MLGLLAVVLLALPLLACPPACDCKWKSGKESAVCVNANLTKLPSQLDPLTQVLDLSGNVFAALGRDSFSSLGLVNLQKLYFSKCRLRSIDRFAFRKLINLVELDLSFNALQSVPSHVFGSVSQLRELKLNGNPIARVGNDAFANVPQLVKLDLSECRIWKVEGRAFTGVEHTLEWLKLDNNRLSEIDPRALTSLVNLHGLELEGNPWNCSCSLRPLKQWLVSHNVPSSVSASCRAPPRLAGLSWDKLTDDEFACIPKVTAPSATVYTTEGMNVSMLCTVEGVPAPTVKWYWRNKPIANMSGPPLNHRKMYLLDTTGTRSTLTIFSVETVDTGSYFCSGSNKAGKAEANVTLSVSKRPPESRLSRQALMAGLIIASLFVLASCLLFCLLGQPKKEPRPTRRDSYEKIELNKKTDENSHPKMKDYKGLPSTDEPDTASNLSDPVKSPSKPNLCDMSASELCKELGVEQHSFLRKEVLPVGSLYTTAYLDNYPDLVATPPAYTTLPRRATRSFSSQSPLLSTASPASRLSNDSNFHRWPGGVGEMEKKSASSLNLYYTGPSSKPKANHWHNPSLPTSPVRDKHSLFQELDNCKETPLLNLLGTDYDYHTTQLDRFLEEYRSLQEQLSKMKEGLVASQTLVASSPQQLGPSTYQQANRDSVRYWANTSSIYGDIFRN